MNRTMYKINKMTTNCQFRYWQSIVVNWMLKMRNKIFTNNYILKNYMKIDKIIETLKYFVIINDFHFQRFIFFSYLIEYVFHQYIIYILHLWKIFTIIFSLNIKLKNYFKHFLVVNTHKMKKLSHILYFCYDSKC